MVLDLTNETLYDADELKIDKKYTFIFGKNGTGKSTITDLIRVQCEESHDVRIFSGFEDVVDSESNLNAVVLGEENSKIKKQIEVLEGEILNLENTKAQIEKGYRMPKEDDPNPNLYTELADLIEQQRIIENNIESSLKAEAAKIKKMENPRFVSTSYNVANLKRDISSAKYISKDEAEEAKKILKSDIKVVEKIEFPSINISDYIVRTNEILAKYVKEQVHVDRVGTNPDKVEFAKKGLVLHKPGDTCIFCGGVVTEKSYQELKTYFSADEVKAFQKEIVDAIELLQIKQSEIDSLKLDKTLFYPMYTKDISDLIERLNEYKKVAVQGRERIILQRLRNEKKKQQSLFLQ